MATACGYNAPMIMKRCLFVAIAFSTLAPIASGGITSENVAVIVNASSVDSITVANHYVALRDVPSGNVIWLDDVPAGNSISLDAFRDQILKPLLEKINERKIAAQIQVVAYSAGFPTGVNIASHTKQLTDPAQKKYQTPTASINSLTYFYRYLLSDAPGYLGWTSNQYARGKFRRHFVNPFAGDNGKEFDAAKTAANEGDFAKAAEMFESLAIDFPTMSPLRILAAENWILAEEEQKGIEQLESAVVAGWASRRHLTDQSPLRETFDVAEGSSLTSRKARIVNSLQDVPITNQGPIPFASSLEWTSSGHAVPNGSGAIPYMLSCVLAVVHPNGNTLEEAVTILTRAAGADRTFPKGTFGFAKTGDVRVTTREPLYVDALAWLLSRDQVVEIFPSALPLNDKRYVGMMLGAANLPLAKREWSFVPGAIAENLTSLGGAFNTKSQTKLTALLNAGAAMSSGAVAEPYSLVPKFPTPMIYPYYCEGVTAIEAFYLSVTSPYQLLIVGDPLCQPFARAPNDLIQIESDPPSDSKTGTIRFRWQPFPDTPQSSPTKAIGLYVLDRMVAITRPTKNIQLNLPKELRGMIDCRAVMIGRHPTEPAITVRQRINFGNEESLPVIQRLRKEDTTQLTLFVDCPAADGIDVMHLGRSVAKIEGESSKITLNPETVGRGPVQLEAVARRDGRVIHGDLFEFDW